ncbi:ChuX/HutX family heme-like substrate-binding protein [Pectobacterium versatile]|uniref:ChuX/HutX family heme-like substrate-binding protein n=1 Tax=Pectobacterium versatile TaxID=2488639 RepID=UPI001CD072CC|nr:ChuX/HutX family heme-like substrate-binding protein [Pectobacterium versatile]
MDGNQKMKINDANYSIKETSAAWGVDFNNSNSLNEILKKIKKISTEAVETTTPGSNYNSLLRVTGKITQPAANGHLLLNPKGVDLRIIPGKIKEISIEKKSADNYDINFLNENKDNVLKINLTSKENIREESLEVTSKQGKLKERDKGKSIESLWRNLADIHHFYPMLEQFGMSKLEAFKAVPDDLACQVDQSSLWSVLASLQREKERSMIFVDNDSVVQIYTGTINKIVELKNKGKLVVHGETEEGQRAIFKITTSNLGEAWVVNKMSEQGYITSLEIFDKNESHIAQFYGMRTEGSKQSEKWVELIKRLPKII